MTDSTCLRSLSESRAARARELAVADLLGERAQRRDRRDDVERGLPLAEAVGLVGDEPLRPRRLAAPAGERLGDDGLEVVDVVEEAAVELVDRRIEVARHGEVDAAAAAVPCGRGAPRRRPSRVRTCSDALVAETTTSARSSSAPIASSSSACAPSAARAPRRARASGSRRPRSSAPRETRFRAVASLIFPAPSTSTRRPARSSKTCCASAAAADGTDAGLSPIAVSSRTRRPACSAWRKSWSRNGPGEPASNAARTWPRISPSPGTSESSPAATRKRCSAAASSRSR